MVNTLEQLDLLVAELDSERREKYQSKLSAIRNRMTYPEMKLALIGNFSCGKSTFLNALMKEPLLAVDNMPTTAIPTYINWNSSKKTKITIMDAHGERRPMGIRTKMWLKRETGQKPPKKRGELIDYLTTTNELHDIVSNVQISYPSKNGYPGFCIIDTPGINPGAEESAKHILQTQMVLREVADAAIILFPCYNVYTRDFREFLESNASHLIENSIFVITKMDQVPTERERRKLIEFVKGHLRHDFGLEEPEVYGCSAGSAVNQYTLRNGDSTQVQWTNEFEQMMDTIFQSLEGRRKKIIDERIHQMLRMLMTDLQETISEQEAALTGNIAVMEQGTVQALEQKYETSLTAYKKLVKEKTDLAYTELAVKITEQLNLIKEEAHNSIYSSKSILALNNALGAIQSKTPKKIHYWMKTALRDDLEKIKKLNLTEYQAFISRIEEVLKGNDFHVGKLNSWKNKMNRYQINRAYLTIPIEIQRPNIGAWPGILILLIITIIGIPIAIIIDACVNVTQRQDTAWESISEQLQKVETSLIECSKNAVSSQCTAFFDAAGPMLNDYRARYQVKFEKRASIVDENLRAIRELLERNKLWLQRLDKLISESGLSQNTTTF